ncbi:MAG: BMP family ABC transporter substrate-binding protein [Actinomycetota bacterium]
MIWKRYVRSFALIAIAPMLASCATPESIKTGFDKGKIGFIFVGTRDDLGYNEAAWEGSEAVAKAFPDMGILRRENVPETPDAELALENMIKKGAKILFATSFGHLKYAYEVAKRHPDVVVLHQGGVEPSPKLDNLGTYWGNVYEPVFQAGIAAGAATKTNNLGYVVAFPIPATYLNVNAFTLGARSVNPKATTRVLFTKDWCDPNKQTTAARELLDLGVDVITQHQDCTRTILEIAETAGVFSIGYHADGSEAAPKGWLVGSVWDWGPSLVGIVNAAINGEFAESPYNGDFRGDYRARDNPFVLTEFGPSVSPETQKLIAAAGKRFKEGGSPFVGPIVDRDGKERIAAGVVPTPADLDALGYFVAGVVGDVAE